MKDDDELFTHMAGRSNTVYTVVPHACGSIPNDVWVCMYLVSHSLLDDGCFAMQVCGPGAEMLIHYNMLSYSLSRLKPVVH